MLVFWPEINLPCAGVSLLARPRAAGEFWLALLPPPTLAALSFEEPPDPARVSEPVFAASGELPLLE